MRERVEEDRTIGIDLGQQNCLAAVWQNGESVLIPDSSGEYLTPSFVSVDGDRIYVGKTAKERMIAHPDETASVFKRYMGRTSSFPSAVDCFVRKNFLHFC